MAQLRAAFAHGDLIAAAPERTREFAACLDRAMAQPWVVYGKPPFAGPVQVLKHLARYTHRVAIDNRRILAVDERGVKFRWRDRAHDNRARTMLLPGVELLRRFLQHVLPRGFPRIRHYGLLGNRSRAVKLAACRLALGATMPASTTSAVVVAPAFTAPSTATAAERCPACGSGHLIRRRLTAASAPAILDSS